MERFPDSGDGTTPEDFAFPPLLLERARLRDLQKQHMQELYQQGLVQQGIEQVCEDWGEEYRMPDDAVLWGGVYIDKDPETGALRSIGIYLQGRFLRQGKHKLKEKVKELYLTVCDFEGITYSITPPYDLEAIQRVFGMVGEIKKAEFESIGPDYLDIIEPEAPAKAA